MRSCWCRLPNPPLLPLPTELPPAGGRGRGDEPPPSMGPKPAWPEGLQSSAEGCRLPSVEGQMVRGRGQRDLEPPPVSGEPPRTCHVEGGGIGAAGGLGRWIGGTVPAIIIT